HRADAPARSRVVDSKGPPFSTLRTLATSAEVNPDGTIFPPRRPCAKEVACANSIDSAPDPIEARACSRFDGALAGPKSMHRRLAFACWACARVSAWWGELKRESTPQ